MSNEVILYKLADMQTMAEAVAKSGLFGMKSPDQALALMLVAQAEGTHPATITQDYDIIQGKACRKTHSVMARFQAMGGKVEWHTLTDTVAEATFSHPSGGSLRMDWTIDQAKRIGLTGKDNWKNYPRAMLRARLIAEAVRSVCPAAIGGMMVAEEAQDSTEFDITPPRRQSGADVAQAARGVVIDAAEQEARDKLLADLNVVATERGLEAYADCWKKLTPEQRKLIGAEEHERLKAMATTVQLDIPQ